MSDRHVLVQTAGGTWHRTSCLYTHVGVTRRRERVVSDSELAALEKTCELCLGGD
jgi:hypothetical protein